MAVRVVTDSTSYIPPEMSAGLPMAIVSLTCTLAGVTRREVEMTSDETEAFYQQMIDTGEFPTSSQPSVAELLEAFEGPVAAGDEVVGVFISEKMSGTLATAAMARDQVLERHPGGRIELVDSRSNSMELGFAALAAAKAAAEGGTVGDVVAAAERMVARSRWYFVPATLDYLKMGGRIGAASALLGSVLDIRPILTVRNGVTDSVRKVRTRQRALTGIAELFTQDVAEKGLGDVVIHHIHDTADAEKLASLVEPAVGHPVRIVPLGPVVGLHVGPGSLGVVYWTLQEQHKDTEGV
jgi:DegV family protein with EDD domain